MDWKELAKKLLFPPFWVQILLSVVSAAALVWVFAGGMDTLPIAYVIYMLAFYTLCVVCVFCVKVLPGKIRVLKEKMLSLQLVNRYVSDREFQSRISLYLSLAVNLLYVGVNLLSWYFNRSWWFVVLAVYYIILAVMRFLLVRFAWLFGLGKDRRRELKSSRMCAVILLLVNVTLSGAVLMMLYQNRGYHYDGILIYVMAMYTFYVTASAIVDIIKYQKYNSPVMSTSKVITLASALVSMLNLETAMFAQFGGEMAPENQRLMIILTGAGVSLVVVSMSAYMIVRSCKEIKRLRSNENG